MLTFVIEMYNNVFIEIKLHYSRSSLVMSYFKRREISNGKLSMIYYSFSDVTRGYHFAEGRYIEVILDNCSTDCYKVFRESMVDQTLVSLKFVNCVLFITNRQFLESHSNIQFLGLALTHACRYPLFLGDKDSELITNITVSKLNSYKKYD